jgi:hypothetical protein
VASVTSLAESPVTQRLALGALKTTTAPEDVVLDVLSGSQLLGRARVRDVVIRSGAARSYVAAVRKPLIFVGAALPDESNPGNMLAPGEILDPTTSLDLANPTGVRPQPPPQLPAGTSSAAVTSDGRFLLAGRTNAVTVVDTGSGRAVGDVPLPFTPTRLAVAARDAAAVAVGPGDATGDGAIAIFADVQALTVNPPAATPRLASLPGVAPRAVSFAADVSRIFVLGGGPSTDPCGPDAAPPPNSIVLLGLDGAPLGAWSLPGFVSDLAVDPDTQQLVVSEAKQVSLLDPRTPAGTATTHPLFGANCPSALHIVDGEVFAVSSDRDPNADNAFLLYRASIRSTAAPQALSFTAPLYQAPTDMPSPDGNVSFEIHLKPTSILSYELAVTPDGNRAEFATRARYHELREPMQLLGSDCTMTVDIVEYGLYSLDTRTGNSAYQSRAQLITAPAGGASCIVCPLTGGGAVEFTCPSLPGDRAAGVAAVFGGP